MDAAGTRQEGRQHPAANVPREPCGHPLSPARGGRLAFPCVHQQGTRERGDVEGRVEKRPRRRQCAKHQGHLGEEGESSFCKRNNICGVGAEHL